MIKATAATPDGRTQDDKANLDDLYQVKRAVDEAQDALRGAMVGQGPRQREQFVFSVGFALGRLRRVSERIDPAREIEAEDTPSFICPGCGFVTYDPHDIEARYCGKRHQFGDDDAP